MAEEDCENESLCPLQTLALAPKYYKKTFQLIKDQEELSECGGLQVINAGLPRTGTLSFKAAITSLLGGRCYHGFDALFGSQEDVDFWVSVAKEEATDTEIREFFSSRGITASADFPAAFFYRRLVSVFPEAKVVLSTRSPTSWQKSMRETIYLVSGESLEKRKEKINHFLYFRLFLKSSTFLHPQAHLNRTKVPWRWGLFALDWRFPRGLDWIYDKMDGLWLDSVLGSEEEAATFFSRWEKGVRDSVPKDRLLVFQAKEGWEPLCQFLDKEVPTSPYPRLNNSAQFRSGYIRHRLVTIVAGAVILLAVTGLSLLLAVLLST